METTDLSNADLTPKVEHPITQVYAPSLLRLGFAALIAGTIGSVLGWVIGEFWYEHHQPSQEAATRPYDFKQLNLEQADADAKNAAIAFGGFGAALGLAMGLAGGLCSRSIPRAIVGGTVGLVLAGSLGAGVSYGLSPIYRKYQDPASADLFLPLMIHATTWGSLAAGAGLAFGFGIGGKHRILKAMVGGLIGAILGTVLFELSASILFPTDRTTQPISVTAHSRLLARILAGVVAALGAAWSIREIRHRPKP